MTHSSAHCGMPVRLLLHLGIDEANADSAPSITPTLHSVVGALQFFLGNRPRVGDLQAVDTPIGNLERGYLGILRLVIVDEVMEIAVLIGIDPPHCFADRQLKAAWVSAPTFSNATSVP